jgi:hypothetical protein
VPDAAFADAKAFISRMKQNFIYFPKNKIIELCVKRNDLTPEPKNRIVYNLQWVINPPIKQPKFSKRSKMHLLLIIIEVLYEKRFLELYDMSDSVCDLR